MPSIRQKPSSDDGDPKTGLLLAFLGVLVAISPFIAGSHALWIALAVGVGCLFFVAAVTIATGSDLDGPPPRRSG